MTLGPTCFHRCVEACRLAAIKSFSQKLLQRGRLKWAVATFQWCTIRSGMSAI